MSSIVRSEGRVTLTHPPAGVSHRKETHLNSVRMPEQQRNRCGDVVKLESDVMLKMVFSSFFSSLQHTTQVSDSGLLMSLDLTLVRDRTCVKRSLRAPLGDE